MAHRKEYIICKRCDTRFDPSRDTKLSFNPLRCESCGKEHTHNDTKLANIAHDTDGIVSYSQLSESGLKSVYLVQSESGAVKIGVSKDVDRRLSDLQVAHPHDLTLLACVESSNANSLENRLHDRYSKYNINGEWFDLPNGELDNIVQKFNEQKESILA